MTILEQLREERGQNAEELRNMDLNAVDEKGESRELDEQEQTRWDELNQKIEDLDKRIKVNNKEKISVRSRLPVLVPPRKTKRMMRSVTILFIKPAGLLPVLNPMRVFTVRCTRKVRKNCVALPMVRLQRARTVFLYHLLLCPNVKNVPCLQKVDHPGVKVVQ